MTFDEKKVVEFLEGHVGDYWKTIWIARQTGIYDGDGRDSKKAWILIT